MKFDKIKNIVGAIAPTLGTALGGPLGGTAASAIASVLGCGNDEKSIERALQQATPEQLTEIKKAEISFQQRCKELEVDVFELETIDAQNARASFADDWTPRVLAVSSFLIFGGYVFSVTFFPLENTSETIVSLTMGYMGGIVSAVCSFYFGASNKKD
tara:strand:+ start:924 stop:1397 length:474 start_codon:yes stop_codon:yes gene_type:complete